MLPETKQLRAYLRYLNENCIGYILEHEPAYGSEPPLLQYEVLSFTRLTHNVSNLNYLEVNVKLLTPYSYVWGWSDRKNVEVGEISSHAFYVEELKKLLETGSLYMNYPPEPTSWRVVSKPKETKNEDA